MRARDRTGGDGEWYGHRALSILIAVVVVAAACGSGGESGETSARAVEEGSPAAAVEFLTYEVQRREIVQAAELVMSDADPLGEPVWELQCQWVPEQAALVRGALPWPPADTSDEWKSYVAATDEYWTEYENACDATDSVDFDGEPDFRDDLWASQEVQLEACEAFRTVLVSRLPSDADVPSCTPAQPASPATFPDLPAELEDSL